MSTNAQIMMQYGSIKTTQSGEPVTVVTFGINIYFKAKTPNGVFGIEFIEK